MTNNQRQHEWRIRNPNYSKEYYKVNKERILERSKQYRESHREEINDKNRRMSLTVNGKKINGLNKRPYPNYCETCGKEKKKRLAYHHWNKTNPNLGIWVCQRCHNIVELIDSDSSKIFEIIEKYYKLKKEITQVV